MTTFLQFALLGLGPAAIYMLLAAGVILVYKGSGVLNFAQGSIAMVGGFVYYELTSNYGWAPIPAVAGSGVLCGLISLVAYGLVMRRLSGASTLIKLVATLALFITIESAGILIWGQTSVQPVSALPTTIITIGHISGTIDKPILLGIATVIAVALWAAFRFTTVGLATRALAENRRGTAALGWSEDRLAAFNWGFSGVLGGVAGALIAPISGLQVASASLLVIPALAAALIGGFRSFPVTLAGAVALGVAQSEAANYISGVQGLADAIPFLLVVVFLVLRGKTIPLRGESNERMPALGSGELRFPVVALAAAAAVAVMLGTFSDGLLTATVTSLEFIVLMLSVVVLTGYAGQLSLATVTFGGVAALVAARLVAGQGWSFGPAAVVGLLAMIPVGILFGVPALRTRGVNLAVVTLGLSTAVTGMVFNNVNLSGIGGSQVGVQHLFGVNIDSTTHLHHWTLVVFGCLLVCVLAVASMRRARAGRRLVALRDNERAAAALGINVVEGKLYAFVLAGVIAGVGGILLGFQNQAIQFGSPSPFDPFQSVLLVVFVVIGGVGFLLGPFYGGLIFISGGTVPYIVSLVFSPSISEYVALAGGLALMAMITVHPDGMFTLHARSANALLERLLRLFRRPMPHTTTSLRERTPHRVKAAALDVQGLTVRFGGVVAVRDVSLTVAPGEVVGLIGPNGAGKTSFIDAVSGFVRPAAGDVRLGERALGRLSAYRRARAGLSRSFQSLELFEDLTVLDNLRAASDARDFRAYVTNLAYARRRPLPAAAVAAVHEFGLGEELESRPSELPYGRRRLVAVARAVAVEPSILLLDEPAAGLDSDETTELAECVRRLADAWGIGVLVVEHDMSFVMGLCDRVVVLEFGRKVAEGPPAKVQTDPAVLAAYLGEEDPTKESDSDESVNTSAEVRR